MQTTTQVLPSLSALLNSLPPGVNGETKSQVRHAYEFAARAHGRARRESGELYIDHDTAVARILLEYEVDTSTLVAALLHDILRPHTGITAETLADSFDEEVVDLVLGLEKLQNYAYAQSQPHNSKPPSVEVIRRAILTIIEGEIRIILIRLADCLQELRRASHLPVKRRQQLAEEAMNIYAPLANRLGIWTMKWEIEDLAFRYLEPDKYREIASKLAERRTERARKVDEAAELLRLKLAEMNMRAEVTGRSKHIYSIYRKMQRKQLDFEQIYDIQALRVIIEPNPEDESQKNGRERDIAEHTLCYQVLGAVHSLWQPIPREFDDYIAAPKSNGYKSLHTAVIDTATGQKLEVQIRTRRMHAEAEKGVAAHWAYKEDGAHFSASFQRRVKNLREFLNALQEADEQEDSATLENDLVDERIYAYTPNGDVVELPAGSTPIDFAYQIHTLVGHSCRGARVNGKMVSLDHKLKSGDQVEIIRAKRGGPSRDWMNAGLGYTGSARTRSKIRQWFRKQERGKNIEQGREVVERELKRLGLNDTFKPGDIAKALKYDDVKEFLARVGFGDVQTAQISGALALMAQNLHPEDEELRPLLLPESPPKPKGLTVRGVSGLQTKMAGCCNPIPPEPIVGYITRGHGVTVHRQDCAQLAAINEPERLIEVDWGIESETYPIPIVVKAYRRPNLIDDMSSILRGQNIVAPKTKTMSSDSVITVYLVVEVTSLKQLNWLLKKFENIPNVIEVRRRRWS